MTEQESCYDFEVGYKINIHQSLASFFSETHSNALESKLSLPKNGYKLDGRSTFVEVSRSAKADLKMFFMRTVCVPDDGKVYKLPPSLSSFPLFSFEDYKNRLVGHSIAFQDGTFLPIYRKCLNTRVIHEILIDY